MEDKVFSSITTTLGLVFTALAIIASAWSVRRQTQQTNLSSRLLKMADVAIHCSQRYDELNKLKRSILDKEAEIAFLKASTADGPIQARINIEAHRVDELWAAYYRGFWALKSDQFDYWLSGVLDHDTFYDWSYYLTIKFKRDLETGGGGMIKNWKGWNKDPNDVDHAGSNPRFVEFTEKLLWLAGEKHKESRVDGRSAGTTIDLPLAVLSAIEELEGTEAQPGFSRRWRNRIETGMDFTYFAEEVRHDLRRRRQHVTHAALRVD